MAGLTLYQAHAADWKDCIRCGLSEGRTRVVLAKGRVPCDVLFVGEAPGEGEDVVGRPFVGPAGALLDEIIDRALQGLPALRMAFTNVIACIPRGEDGAKVAEPPKDAVKACRPRLLEFMRLCRPRLIVLVGRHAQKAGRLDMSDIPKGVWPDNSPFDYCELTHPAAILRAGIATQGYEVQRAVARLRTAFEELG